MHMRNYMWVGSWIFVLNDVAEVVGHRAWCMGKGKLKQVFERDDKRHCIWTNNIVTFQKQLKECVSQITGYPQRIKMRSKQF